MFNSHLNWILALFSGLLVLIYICQNIFSTPNTCQNTKINHAFFFPGVQFQTTPATSIKIEQFLGQGQDGQVWRVTQKQCTNSQKCKSIKLALKCRTCKESLKAELVKLKRGRGKQVIRAFEEVSLIPGEYCFTMELGTPLPETNDYHSLKHRYQQLLKGLALLHERGIAHGDVAERNIVHTNTAKWIDFSSARQFHTASKEGREAWALDIQRFGMLLKAVFLKVPGNALRPCWEWKAAELAERMRKISSSEVDQNTAGQFLKDSWWHLKKRILRTNILH